VKWKFVLVRLEIVLISMKVRCMVCAECTMRMGTIWGAPDGTPR
jgi:hypothetical protein